MVWSPQVTAAIIGVTVVLVLSIIERTITYGKLSQKVEGLDHTIHNGLSSKMDQACVDLAGLKGNVETYMNLEQESIHLLSQRLDTLEKMRHGG